MLKPLKHRVGLWLLASLIPALVVFIAALTLDGEDETPFFIAAIGSLSALYFLIALILGPSLIIAGNIQFNRAYRASMEYAQRNGWHPISRTSWRTRKNDKTDLSVSQSFQRRTFLLQMESEGDTVTIDEFESSLWALQFGDWVWSALLEDDTAPSRQVIDAKKAEWETTALAPLSPPSAPKSNLANRIDEVVSRRTSPPPNPEYIYATPAQPQRPTQRKDRATAAVLAILLGWLGIHKFYLGHVWLGVAYIAGSILLLGFGWIITGLMGVAEGIIYLTKTDEEFHTLYVIERKPMF